MIINATYVSFRVIWYKHCALQNTNTHIPYCTVQQTVCHVLNQFLYHFCVYYTLVTTHAGPLKSSWVCLILRVSICGRWLVCSLSCFLVGLCFQAPASTIKSPIFARCWAPLHYSCSTMLTKAVGSSTSSLDSGHSR